MNKTASFKTAVNKTLRVLITNLEVLCHREPDLRSLPRVSLVTTKGPLLSHGPADASPRLDVEATNMRAIHVVKEPQYTS